MCCVYFLVEDKVQKDEVDHFAHVVKVSNMQFYVVKVSDTQFSLASVYNFRR